MGAVELLQFTSFNEQTAMVLILITIVFYGLAFFGRNEAMKALGSLGVAVISFIVMANVSLILGILVFISAMALMFGATEK